MSFLINPYIYGAENKYILDIYSGAAAAYSLRKLSSSYAGDCIRVRRSSDNVEQNIGFVNNVLDTTSLLSFVGAGNGFITTWYDQSGNGLHGLQTTAANQPQIVSSGSILTLNSKPTIKFDGTNDYLLTNNYNFLSTNKIHTSIVSSCETNNTTRMALGFIDNSTYRSFASMYYQSSGNFAAQYSGNNTLVGTKVFTSYYVNVQYLMQAFYDTTNAIAVNRIFGYVNNILLTQTSNSTMQTSIQANNKPLSIGADGLGNFRMQGNIQEILFYSSDQILNRMGIASNINTFYSIY